MQADLYDGSKMVAVVCCCYSTSSQRPHVCCPLMNKVENINCGLVWACVRITPKISPFALWDLGHHLTHGYLGPQKSTLQTAS